LFLGPRFPLREAWSAVVDDVGVVGCREVGSVDGWCMHWKACDGLNSARDNVSILRCSALDGVDCD